MRVSTWLLAALMLLQVAQVYLLLGIVGQINTLVEAPQEEREPQIGFRSETAPAPDDEEFVELEYQEPDPLTYNRRSNK